MDEGVCMELDGCGGYQDIEEGRVFEENHRNNRTFLAIRDENGWNWMFVLWEKSEQRVFGNI